MSPFGIVGVPHSVSHVTRRLSNANSHTTSDVTPHVSQMDFMSLSNGQRPPSGKFAIEGKTKIEVGTERQSKAVT